MFTRKDIIGLTSVESFHKYKPYEFEYACKYLLDKHEKYEQVRVTKKGPKGGDGGIDLKMRTRDGKLVYGQCKLYRTNHNNLIKIIRELAGCMMPDKVEAGLLFVTIKANEYEKREAKRRGIKIIDYYLLDSYIHQ